MHTEWSAIVDVEQGDDDLFVPVLMLFAPGEEEALRVPLNGVYWSAADAVKAARRAIWESAAAPPDATDHRD